MSSPAHPEPAPDQAPGAPETPGAAGAPEVVVRHIPLAPTEQAAVHRLAERAEAADGVAPLSEAFLLALGDAEAVHLLVPAPGGELAAYGQVHREAGELVVDPAYRRRGLGGAMLAGVHQAGAESVWAHGDLPGARELARHTGWPAVRLLHKMSRPLTPADAHAGGPIPAGFRLAQFRPGDEEAWLRVNSRAFAAHPEQGRVTRADLDRLLAQPWFEPAGLLLLRDESNGALAGSHWTKVDPDERAPGADGQPVPAGEVYVLGMDPAYHGRGLAGPLTAAGLRHLAGQGLGAVVLYVDGDNERALRTYRKLGFTDAEVHRAYAPPVAADKMTV